MRRTSHNRHAAVAYLRAELEKLSADYEVLLREFELLAERRYDRHAHAMCRRKLRHFRGLLANHRLAWQWTYYPRCATDAPPLRCFYPIAASPTDFAVTSAAESQ